VDYILGQITRKMAAFIEKKKKINVNQNTIKEQLILFCGAILRTRRSTARPRTT
jgi:hypothetical protein